MSHNIWKTAQLFAISLSVIVLFSTSEAGEDEGFQISGFVDASYFVDSNDENSFFGLDQAEVDVTRSFQDRASLRADIDYTNDGEGGFSADLEQGYLAVYADWSKGVDFTFGKFNIPMGFELLDAVDMYQFSHSLLFNYAIPTNVTGLMISPTISDKLDLSLYVVNGWDVNSDNNKDKTFGGRLGITPIEGVNFGLSGIIGAEKNDNGDDLRSVFDLDITITTVENLTLGGEFNIGSEEIGDESGNWTGVMVMAHYDCSDWAGITGRFDLLDDDDGLRFGEGSQQRISITVAPTFTVADGAGILLEYRFDKSDEEVFVEEDGKTDNNSTIALEFTYAF